MWWHWDPNTCLFPQYVASWPIFRRNALQITEQTAHPQTRFPEPPPLAFIFLSL